LASPGIYFTFDRHGNQAHHQARRVRRGRSALATKAPAATSHSLTTCRVSINAVRSRPTPILAGLGLV
jgi:hypothetical protein